ncbi:MAG: hypothetical protein Ta2A_11430 [Treponemataceae bacterium]|nr:MAG: hypothetical protein Ta2A_11430 [Treponemataceae bacterium]
MNNALTSKGILTYNGFATALGINIGDYIQSLAAQSFYDTVAAILNLKLFY